MKITKQDNMIEVNITPLFYIQIYEQWSQFFKPGEDFYNFVFFLLDYEEDKMLDLHTVTLGFCGIVICFKKNTLK